MKPTILYLILTLLHAPPAGAQLATIRDADGYTNVRAGDSIKAKIVGRLHEGDVFVTTYTKNGWTTIYYSPSETSDSGYLTGYIHADRLVIVEDLPHIADSGKTLGKNHLRLQNDSVTVELTRAAFRPGEQVLRRDKDGQLRKIDGRKPIGTDGTMPAQKLTSLRMTIAGKPVVIPQTAWDDVYDLPFWNIDMFFDRTTGFMYLVIPAGGEAAEAAYELAWIFKDGRYVKRYVDGF